MKWFLFSLALITGCAPTVSNPRIYVDVPCTWSTCYSDFSEESPHDFCSWKSLNDPILDEMIESLSAKNLDLLTKAEENYKKPGVRSIQNQEYRMLWNQTAFDTAKTYIELRLLQEKRSILNARIDSLQDSSHLIDDLWDKGFTNSIEKSQETERLALLKSEIAKIDLGEQIAINHLSVLLGRAPNDLSCLLKGKAKLPALPDCLPIGFPCESILQRPDVLITEIAVKNGHQPISAYQKSVLAALEEVENALAAIKYSNESGKELRNALQESYKAYIQTDDL